MTLNSTRSLICLRHCSTTSFRRTTSPILIGSNCMSHASVSILLLFTLIALLIILAKWDLFFPMYDRIFSTYSCSLNSKKWNNSLWTGFWKSQVRNKSKTLSWIWERSSVADFKCEFTPMAANLSSLDLRISNCSVNWFVSFFRRALLTSLDDNPWKNAQSSHATSSGTIWHFARAW